MVDANFNRVKEALRVCEDVCRFFLAMSVLTRQYKNTRHEITLLVETLSIHDMILSREIEHDVGRATTESELKRENVSDIFYANSQRAKESIRVLEECIKLIDKKAALELKRLRYKIYGLEKKVIERL